MKKLILLLILISSFAFSQKNKDIILNCYLPTGEKCSPEKSISKIQKEYVKNFEEKGRVWNITSNNSEAQVYYKSFTKTPLFILFFDKKKYSSDKINDIINSINENSNSGFNYYFGTIIDGEKFVGLKSDLKKNIELKNIDEKFILETLGEPTEYKTSLYDGKPVNCMIYKDYGIRIYFSNSIAINYDVMDL